MERLKSLVLIGNSPSADNADKICACGVLSPRTTRSSFVAAFVPLLFISLANLISGCSLNASDPSEVVESRLNGRGPVYVSPDNPYIAANQFLKSEAERSFVLAGLLKLRGNPQRVEYSHNIWDNPRLVLYYDKSHETLEATKVNGTWVVEQPGASNSSPGEKVYPQHAEHAATGHAESVPAESVQKIVSNKVISEPTPANSPPKAPNAFRSEQQAPKQGPMLSSVVARCRELTGLSPAERSPGGDLIHYVVDDRETVALVAEWYTGEAATAGALIRLNKLTSKQSLMVGDQVVIPKYLVKNGMQLGSRALRCVLTEKAINSLQ